MQMIQAESVVSKRQRLQSALQQAKVLQLLMLVLAQVRCCYICSVLNNFE